MSDWHLLAESTRGDVVENQYFGIAVVCDTLGNIVHAWGNPERAVFPRSALKPMQALPAVSSGATDHYGFANQHLAMLCASHSGQPMHVALIGEMLGKLGLDTQSLQCGRHQPYYDVAHMDDGLPPLSHYNATHHNCSGKHTGFLACACHQQADTAHYLDPLHPVQKAVQQSIVELSGEAASAVHAATDGCSAPTYALPLRGLATAYARIAAATTASPDSAEGQLGLAMMAHPTLVSGTGRGDEFLMQLMPDACIAKMGADGIQAIGLPQHGLGIAIKIADGNGRAPVMAALSVLQHLKVLPDLTPKQHAEWLRVPLHNARGICVGEIRPRPIV